MSLSRLLSLCFVLSGGVVLGAESLRGEGRKRPWDVSFEGVGVLLENGTAALGCGEKITAHLTLPWGTGDHLLKVLWVRPDGGVEQETVVHIKLNDKTFGRAFVWLLLNPEKENLFSDFSLGNVRGKSDSYNGRWMIEVFLDDKFIRREPFLVSC